jgi:phosphatidate phosphatase APP1
MNTDQITTSKPSGAVVLSSHYDGWLNKLLRINSRPVVKVYHGYGDNDRVLVLGHVMLRSPDQYEHYRKGLFYNTLSLIRLFMVRPAPAGIKVIIRLGTEVREAVTSHDGFFAADWDSGLELDPGWHRVTAELAGNPRIIGEGKIYVPPPDGWAFISDIDDTFLISHSADLGRRLYVLLTKNARSRKPFEGVVEHYRELSNISADSEHQHPFFYVSSSEWNLYEYIKEFCRFHKLPEGVFLLSPVKSLASFWKTGQGKHSAKYVRIVRIFKEFPKLDFILLGDDSQQDPYIYARLAKDFPGRVKVVYIRHRVKEHLPQVRKAEAEMKALGVEVCYFTHSETARKHSRDFGLTGGGESK